MHSGNQRWTLYTLIPVVTMALLTLGLLQSEGHGKEASLNDLEEAVVKTAEKVIPVVVNIHITKKAAVGKKLDYINKLPKDHPFRKFFGDEFFKKLPDKSGSSRRKFRQKGLGSGVIVSSDGLILTNDHVVSGADTITVKLSDKRSFKAKMIGADRQSDLAVIKISASNLPKAEFGDSDELRVGQFVLALGCPFGFSKTVTFGVVSAKGRSNVGAADDEDFIQTDASINPGNAGGPLVNTRGQVVGINVAIATRSGSYQGIGFAIPSNQVKPIMKALIKDGRVRRGLLGVNIQGITPQLAKSLGTSTTQGALVTAVVKGGAAEKAGIKSEDIVIKINGRSVNDASDLKNIVGRLAPGTEATIVIIRKGKTITKRAVLDEQRAHKIEPLKELMAQKASKALGIEVEETPKDVTKKLGLKPGQGVRITDVEKGGIGASLALKIGDIIMEVNGKSVTGVSSFKEGVNEAKQKKVIRIKIKRGKLSPYIVASYLE